MSEETQKKEDQKADDKKARCSITKLFYHVESQTVSCEAVLTGKIKSEDKWSIEDASTVVKLVKVPIRDLIGRVLVGWFWVRKVQDVLRKGTIADARKRINQGYDWTEETTRSAATAAPEVVAERAIGKMTPEQLAEFIKKATALMEQAKASEPEKSE